MENKLAFTALAATALAGAAGLAYYFTDRSRAALAQDSCIIPIISPVIDLRVADYVLARMGRISGDEVTVVLHTPGGCVTSCVMIANALGQFPRSTAVVPYMAISGGTLIALSARAIAMGRHAALSAVDPVVFGRRAKHIEAGDEEGLHATAREYEEAMRRHLRGTLRARLEAIRGPAGVDKAMEVFMGEKAPHEWPIYTRELVDLGLPVRPAERRWRLVERTGMWTTLTGGEQLATGQSSTPASAAGTCRASGPARLGTSAVAKSRRLRHAPRVGGTALVGTRKCDSIPTLA